MAFDRFRTPRPELTARAVRRQPAGLDAPTAFGTPAPNVPARADARRDRAGQRPTSASRVPPVELVEVDDPVAMVRAASRLVVVAGSGDGIVDAAAAGLLHGDEAVLYAADLARRRPARRRRPRRSSPTRTAIAPTSGAARRTSSASPRPAAPAPTSCSATPPINACRCSPTSTVEHRRPPRSRASDVRATGYGEPFAYRPEDRPAMAVDGDPSTAWVVGDRFDPIGQTHRGDRRCLPTCRCCNRNNPARHE